MSRLFTFSEAWGPFNCEHAGCEEMAFAVLLSDAENNLVSALSEGGSGPQAAAYIFDHKLGVACCDDHLPDPNTL